jgi:hypothetical protein
MATTKPNLYQRLLAITSQASVAKEGKADPKMGGFAFHKIDDVDSALGPLFVKHGVFRSIDVKAMDTQVIQGYNNKNVYISTATIEVTYTNAVDTDESVSVTSFGRGIDFSDKSEGKAISYASKNHSLSMFCLRGQHDNEAEVVEHEPTPQPKPTGNRNITEKQQRRLFALAKENGWKPDEMKEWLKLKFGYEHSNEIPMSEYDAVVEFYTGESPQSAEEAKATADLDAIAEPPDDEGFVPPTGDEVLF